MSSDDKVHLHVYGIPNCDTVRSALKWLGARAVPHTFHDFRGEGVPEATLRHWLSSSHGQYLLNKRSATWRQLTPGEKREAESDPVPMFIEHPTLIKRPVVTDGKTILGVGFSPQSLEDYI